MEQIHINHLLTSRCAQKTYDLDDRDSDDSDSDDSDSDNSMESDFSLNSQRS